MKHVVDAFWWLYACKSHPCLHPRLCNVRVFLVTVHDPICTEDGDLEAALYGSFLPIPKQDAFPAVNAVDYSRENAPGAVGVKNERIYINHGRERVKLRVTNNGDRPIQVREHSCGDPHTTSGRECG